VQPPNGTAKRPSPRRTTVGRIVAGRAGRQACREKINPGEVYKLGIQAYVRGDTKTALASLKRVLQANPTTRGRGAASA